MQVPYFWAFGLFTLASAMPTALTTTTESYYDWYANTGDPDIIQNRNNIMPPEGYTDGPMPTISDSLFSLIILIYVSVVFIFMFFSFCWKQPTPPPPDPAHKNIPMITSILEEMEKQQRLEEEQQNEGNICGIESQGGHDEGGGGGGEMLEMQEKPLISSGGEKIVVNVITEKSVVTLAQETIKEEEENANTSTATPV